VRTGRFLIAVLVSLAVILSAPFIRDIRDWIRSNFPGQFVTFVAAGIAFAIGAAIAAALYKIRDRRATRYGAIVAALVLGTGYALWNAQGNSEVDTVERFHFVEYGLITFLFYRAWRPVGDISIVILPVLAGLVVGTLEEWLQWFIPGRIGDMRDVFLNCAAIVCGLLFSLGVDPPERLSLRLAPGSRRRIAAAAAIAALVFATFVHTVHLGVSVGEGGVLTFRSRYDADELRRIAEQRAIAWKASPPLARPASRSREDQYQSEGHQHVQERNRQWAAGNITAAWYENQILETFYTPVLDTPSYLSKTGHRWPAEQRADAQQRHESAGASASRSYESLADAAEGRHFIRTWPPVVFWAIVGLVVVGLAVVGGLRA
jgi:VanZ family protein